MKIQIITSCTGEKISYDSTKFFKAENLYSGEQHTRLMVGIQRMRQTYGAACINLWIMSAKHGLIPGSLLISPYNYTFQGMHKSAIRRVAEERHIPQRMRENLALDHDLTIVLLGETYYEACGNIQGMTLASPTIFLCSKNVSSLISRLPSSIILALGPNDTKKFSCGLIGLKGEVAGRMLVRLAEDSSFLNTIISKKNKVLALLQGAKRQSTFGFMKEDIS
jgi:hypothetical protein